MAKKTGSTLPTPTFLGGLKRLGSMDMETQKHGNEHNEITFLTNIRYRNMRQTCKYKIYRGLSVNIGFHNINQRPPLWVTPFITHNANT